MESVCDLLVFWGCFWGSLGLCGCGVGFLISGWMC